MSLRLTASRNWSRLRRIPNLLTTNTWGERVMTFSRTKAFKPLMTETTPTRVVTPMMMPRRVRTLLRAWARMARSASRVSSRRSMSDRAPLLALLGFLQLNGVGRLEGAQGLEGPRDQGLASPQPLAHLHVEFAQQARLDRLKAGLAALHEVDAFLLAGGARLGGLPGLALDVADHEGLDGDDQGPGGEAGEDVRLHGEAGLDVGGRVLDLDLDLELDGLRLGVRLHEGAVAHFRDQALEALVGVGVDTDPCLLAQLDVRDRGLVHLHLRLHHRHVGDGEEHGPGLLQHPHHRHLALLHPVGGAAPLHA